MSIGVEIATKFLDSCIHGSFKRKSLARTLKSFSSNQHLELIIDTNTTCKLTKSFSTCITYLLLLLQTCISWENSLECKGCNLKIRINFEGGEQDTHALKCIPLLFLGRWRKLWSPYSWLWWHSWHSWLLCQLWWHN